MRVIVAYASQHGSTGDIADAIARRLEASGIHATATPFAALNDSGGAEALVLGSAIHSGQWLDEATAWIDAHAPAATGPMWLFSVSTLGDTTSVFGRWLSRRLRRVRTEPSTVRTLRSSHDVRDHRNFAGVVERRQWGRRGDLFLRLFGGRYGDHRDWQAIDAWSDGIAAALGGETAAKAGAAAASSFDARR